jgi:preprotein translocase subunit Sec63
MRKRLNLLVILTSDPMKQILGVKKTATDAELKKQYRKVRLSVSYHVYVCALT